MGVGVDDGADVGLGASDGVGVFCGVGFVVGGPEPVQVTVDVMASAPFLEREVIVYA